MHKNTVIIVLALLAVAFPIWAATTDFVANGNITVSGVTFGDTTANMLIVDGSTAESWSFDGGTFTITNPDSVFKIGSVQDSVESIYIKENGVNIACVVNATPGTTSISLPTTAATYTVTPSSNAGFATSDCCSTVSHVATYSAYPTCAATSCSSGYRLSGSGASATCLPIGGGGSPGGSAGASASVASLGLPVSSATPSPSASATPSPSPSSSSATPTLIRYADSPKVYVVENNQKRWIQTAEDFAKLGYKWSDVKITPTTQTYTDGTVKTPSASSAVTLIRYANSPKVYVVENSQKRWIQTAEDFAKLGYKWSDVKIAPTTEAYADGATKTVSATTATFTKTLKRGSSGSEVKTLQQKLKDLGYFPADVSTTTYFGPVTQTALKAFQKAKNLTQNGQTDTAARALLNSL